MMRVLMMRTLIICFLMLATLLSPAALFLYMIRIVDMEKQSECLDCMLTLRYHPQLNIKHLSKENVTNPPPMKNHASISDGMDVHRGMEIKQKTFKKLIKENVTNPPMKNHASIRDEVHRRKKINEITPTKLKKEMDIGMKIKGITSEKLRKDMCKMGGKSEYCELKGDIRIDSKEPTVYYVVPRERNYTMGRSLLATIRPYARNNDPFAMASVRKWSIKVMSENHPDLPPCSPTQASAATAIIFSLAGYCGNTFHAMTDIIVPLFATARPFDRQVHLLTTNHRPWFVSRFNTIMHALSRYEVVDIDEEQQRGETHCFSRLTLGLKGSHDNIELHINKSESGGLTTLDLKQFLRSAFALNRTTSRERDKKRLPRLFIVDRPKTRALTNINDVAAMGREIGFEVTVAELDMNISRTAEIVNSYDVLMGVHGAGLTNLVFLPEDAVLIQVVPFAADWVSKNAFGDPSKGMNLRYLEYRIQKEESSLLRRYLPDNVVLTHPEFLARQGWQKWGSIYLDNQNVTLDLERFRSTLVNAFTLLQQ